MRTKETHERLARLWHCGVQAVGGYEAVETYLETNNTEAPTLILAVGKAAEAMYLAAADRFGRAIPHFIATKHGHLTVLTEGEDAICSGHPTPDENSLRAGEELLRRVAAAGPEERLLMLVSGGASAIAELPEEGLTLNALMRRNDRLVSGGLSIGEINEERKKVSRIKGGKLLAAFRGREALTLALSDVEGDGIDVIGSGLGAMGDGGTAAYRGVVVASNRIAREAVEKAARAEGLVVLGNEESLYRDVEAAARHIVRKVSGKGSGLWVFGGEPTVRLPDNPGKGGRNQALALLIAREIAGQEGLRLLVAGTDGTDGPTDAAGAIVDGQTWGPGAQEALDGADAWSWLKARGCLFVTGPTGTNVMDLVIAERRIAG